MFAGPTQGLGCAHDQWLRAGCRAAVSRDVRKPASRFPLEACAPARAHAFPRRSAPTQGVAVCRGLRTGADGVRRERPDRSGTPALLGGVGSPGRAPPRAGGCIPSQRTPARSARRVHSTMEASPSRSVVRGAYPKAARATVVSAAVCTTSPRAGGRWMSSIGPHKPSRRSITERNDVRDPPPMLATPHQGEAAALRMARTTSDTYVKSRVCDPSP